MIELKNVTRQFKEGMGIKDVSFKIADNSVVVFIGDNGAGKTTTIRAIASELKLQKGEILIDGQSLFENNNLKRLAFFPDTEVIPKDLNVDEYVRYTCAAHGIRRKKMLEKSEGIFKLLNLEPYINKKIKFLSSGIKKRVAMASVLALSPTYIFFDEPTANLDIESKIEFQQIIKVLSSIGVTILITSHLIEELQEIATHLVLINKGEIVYDKEFDPKTEKIIEIYKKFTKSIEIDTEVIQKLYWED
ncbi:ABC transporter ATP-binding protein [Spiroplasma culicicola]|uniref:ABC-2 type transport system ATP-binding protein n=1 Tax=Spiroplasma culicicola AES-1 TaxID=1276246 RepID=W6A7N9_9MOLU|nr:ABC transporter ATP-binding protein [Spiroplasma culicicola]AHI52880.1 ABC-2 type transport system ATP-binding protein [Spiroplasma culicicola AES-1]